ncbi:Bax inhibitor-1 family protein [Wohlfahrtiimonas chitiniclastica]|uniref:Bax inhibitor-1 family protein n=1 Tax=Wohlfahrtiimonas chitiniclastica TaxID=400946 RepID=UPI001BCEDDDE|nr:Bax inhibitor-1 family protein [Wohlfahrtiimonas chitiniclastica]MBS7814627.1 Bax inhibitor-1 family protein [Wohlfahrtiimonas chitiniclastica]
MNSHYQQNSEVFSGSNALASNKVIRQAYALVGISLLPTALGVWLGYMSNGLLMRIAGNSPIMYFVGVMAIFYGLIFMIEKNRRNSTGLALMFVFTLLMGLMLQPLLAMVSNMNNGMSLISTAVFGTAAIFVGLAFIGNNASKDYSFLGRYVGILFIVLMITIVLNYFFLKMPMISLFVSFAVIVFSSMIIVYRINMAARGGEDSYISLALDIYISLYNIFTSLLRILAIFNDD